MSTRGAIAQPIPGGWRGRYHHFDSYPSGLGQTLWKLYHEHFDGDIERMWQVLLYDHPAGWSTIVDRDFSLAPGYTAFDSGGCEHCRQNRLAPIHTGREPGCEYSASEADRRPQCYCHGDRSEEPMPFLIEQGSCTETCDPLFIEWVYVLTPNQMITLENKQDENGHDYGHCRYLHRVKAEIPWDSDEPNWDKLNGWDEE